MLAANFIKKQAYFQDRVVGRMRATLNRFSCEQDKGFLWYPIVSSLICCLSEKAYTAHLKNYA
jgi:hypothetical protein